MDVLAEPVGQAIGGFRPAGATLTTPDARVAAIPRTVHVMFRMSHVIRSVAPGCPGDRARHTAAVVNEPLRRPLRPHARVCAVLEDVAAGTRRSLWRGSRVHCSRLVGHGVEELDKSLMPPGVDHAPACVATGSYEFCRRR